MNLFHFSDLHLGKSVNGFSMLNDQQYILDRILSEVKNEQPDGIMIAGDVFDKSMPSEEAVHLFDEFLFQLAEMKTEVFLISGNHDSNIRLACHNRLMRKNIHIAPAYSDKKIEPVMLSNIAVWMLPFIKPANVRHFLDEEEKKKAIGDSYTAALRYVIEAMPLDKNTANICIAHQFVTGSERCESESSVGGVDNVDANVFDPFDYVALGHLHGKQHAGRETVRYCGSPLKYSLSEVDHKKTITIVELTSKTVNIRELPLQPLRDMRKIPPGTFDELMDKKNYTEDYVGITLTDDLEKPGASNDLRSVYPNWIEFKYDNARTRADRMLNLLANIRDKQPIELFAEFYAQQNGHAPTDRQLELVKTILTHNYY